MIDAYVINLEHRIDRKEHMIKEFSNINLNLIFINAVKESPGWVGCLKSHLKIIELAKEKNLDYVLILEDDNIIIDKVNFNKRLETIITYLNNNLDKWQIFNGSPVLNKNTILYDKFKINNEVFANIQTCCMANFIIYNKNTFDFLLSYLKLIKYKLKDTYKIDMILSKKLKTTVIHPILCQQLNNSPSDITMNDKTEIDKKYYFSNIILKRLVK